MFFRHVLDHTIFIYVVAIHSHRLFRSNKSQRHNFTIPILKQRSAVWRTWQSQWKVCPFFIDSTIHIFLLFVFSATYIKEFHLCLLQSIYEGGQDRADDSEDEYDRVDRTQRVHKLWQKRLHALATRHIHKCKAGLLWKGIKQIKNID